MKGWEEDHGARPWNEPGASPQPSHASCKLLCCSTASSYEGAQLISFCFPACSGQALTDSSIYICSWCGVQHLSGFPPSLRRKGWINQSCLLGCKPWPTAGCNDSVSRKFFSCFSDQSLEQSRGLCRRAELQQLLSLPAVLFAPAMAPCQQPWPYLISLLAWTHKFFLNSASTRIFLGILDRGG